MASKKLLEIGAAVVNPNSSSEELRKAREALGRLSILERKQLHRVSIASGWGGAQLTQKQALQSIAVKLWQMEKQAKAAESAGFPASRVRREGKLLVPKAYHPKAAMRK